MLSPKFLSVSESKLDALVGKNKEIKLALSSRLYQPKGLRAPSVRHEWTAWRHTLELESCPRRSGGIGSPLAPTYDEGDDDAQLPFTIHPSRERLKNG